MRLRKTIKANARLALCRHWCRAAAIAMIVMLFWALFTALEELLMTVFNAAGFVDIMQTPQLVLDDIPNVSWPAMVISAVAAAAFLFVMAPLKLGVTWWYYQLTDGQGRPTSEIFRYFLSPSKFFRAVWFKITLFCRKLFWSVIFLVLPAAAIAAGSMWSGRASRDIETLLSKGLEIIGVISLIISLILLAIWLMRYYLAAYMLANDDDISPRLAVKQSIDISSGRLSEFFMLEISMIGWDILDMMILPRLFTLPYRGVIRGLYARYLLELQRRANAERAFSSPEAEQS